MNDPIDVPEPEPELEPHSDKFFSMGVVLRNLPYLAVLALAIFGVAYSNFSGHPINGYWEFLAIASLLVIAVAVNVYSNRTPYAGFYALPVCLAAAALLATGRDRSTLVARLLSVRPLVFTGIGAAIVAAHRPHVNGKRQHGRQHDDAGPAPASDRTGNAGAARNEG